MFPARRAWLQPDVVIVPFRLPTNARRIQEPNSLLIHCAHTPRCSHRGGPEILRTFGFRIKSAAPTVDAARAHCMLCRQRASPALHAVRAAHSAWRMLKLAIVTGHTPGSRACFFVCSQPTSATMRTAYRWFMLELLPHTPPPSAISIRKHFLNLILAFGPH
eukprot:3287302-Rhodomonas_salina.2